MGCVGLTDSQSTISQTVHFHSKLVLCVNLKVLWFRALRGESVTAHEATMNLV